MWLCRVQQDEPRAGDQRADQAPLLDRHDAIAAGVHHQGPGRHQRRQLGHIDVAAGVVQAGGGVRRRRASLQLVVPRHLLGCAVGQEEHAEHAPERRARIRPAGADRGDQRVLLLALAGLAPLAATQVAAVEDEIGDALGMADRVDEGDRRRPARFRATRSARAPPRRPPLRDRRPMRRPTARRRRGRRAHTRARRSARRCGARRGRSASGARPGSPGRSRDASARSPPVPAAVPRPCVA